MMRLASTVGLILKLVSVSAQQCNFICNESFETPNVSPSIGLIPYASTQCWQTTAPDGLIELWSSGYWGVFSYSGNQHLELNANFVSTVYQDFYVNPGTNLSISFAHRGRAGIDTMSVTFGPVGGPYNLLGVYADSTVWGYYTVYLTVPNLGNYYSLRFNSISAALGLPSVGNFLDDVSVCLSSVNVYENLNEKVFSIFPNPFSHSISVLLPEANGLPVQITLIDLHGKTVYESKQTVPENNILNSEIPGICNGIYLLKAECSGAVYYQKIIRLE